MPPTAPPNPAPPLNTLYPCTRVSASMSGPPLNANFPAANAIDGDYSSIMASQLGSANWLSINLGSPTPVTYAAVYNRPDGANYLECFEVWLGDSPGALGTKCGPRTCFDAAQAANVPYFLGCGGATSTQRPPIVSRSTCPWRAAA